MPRTARLPISSHGRTPGLSLGGLRGGRSRACGDPGTAGEGAQPHSRFLAPGPPQPGGVLWPLSYTKARSLCRKKSIRVQTPAEDAGRRGSPACATRRCPGRAPQPPTLLPARRTPLPSPPEPESRSATWAAWLGVPGQQEAVHGRGTCSRHARELTACGRARARGAPLLARPRASRPMIFGKKSANGQSGVYFQSANNDFFSRVKRQCLRARSGGF